MITISETFVAPHPVPPVFDLVVDFGRIAAWDPNVASSRLRDPDAPLAVGAKADLEVIFGMRTLPMVYELLELEPGAHAVWRGENATSVTTDDIRFEPAPGGGTRVVWTATLGFKGPLSLFDRAAKRAFTRLGRETVSALARALSQPDLALLEPTPDGPGAAATLMGAAASVMDAAVAPSFGAPGYHARRRTWADPDVDVDLTGRRMVVTGANSGLGLATSRALASRGARVVMVCRNPERGEAARDALAAELPGASLDLELADMGDLDQVAALARRLGRAPLHALVHNAGALVHDRQRTPQGHELTFGVHVLGPHLLTRLLEPALADAQDARVVFVSSGGMYTQRLDLARLPDGLAPYDGTRVYAQAKRAQVILARHWAERLGPRGVAVSSMHPGWADTPGVRGALPGFHKVTRAMLRTPAQGADTIVWLAASPEASLAHGGFYLDREPRPEHMPLARTRSPKADELALWELCGRLTRDWA
jgi:NAD(P)-dependent dehydrogenase (short-subunit alcohol dehydrogenase family)